MSTLYHTILAIVIASVLWPIVLFSPAIAAGVAAAWCIYLREVTQKQSAKYDNNFRYGWNAFTWDRDKQVETFVPVALIISIGIIVAAF